MQDKKRIDGLEIAWLRPGNPRFHGREPGGTKLALQRLRITVIVMHGKFDLTTSPGHNEVDKFDQRSEGQHSSRCPEEGETTWHEMQGDATRFEDPAHMPNRGRNVRHVLKKGAGKDNVGWGARHRQPRRYIRNSRFGYIAVQSELRC